jgi:hypothetical protein
MKVKSSNNTSKWQTEFNSAFKGLRMGAALPPFAPYACNLQRENCLILKFPIVMHFLFQNTRNIDSSWREMEERV